MGCRVGHRQLFRGDPALRVDVGDRGTDRRPPRPQAPARDVARRGDGGRGGQAQRHRDSAGRGDLARACATSTCTGSTGSGQTRGHGVLVRYADDLLVMCRDRAGSRARPCGAHGDPGRAGPRAQGRQDADRAPDGRRRGARLPRLPPPLGARQHPALAASHASSPAGPHGRRCSAPATGSVRLTDRAQAAGARRGDRAGPQPVPARLGGLLPLRKLGPSLRQDRPLTRCDRLARFVAKRHKRRRGYGWKVVAYQSPDRLGPDQPQRNHRRATAQPAVATGTAECRR